MIEEILTKRSTTSNNSQLKPLSGRPKTSHFNKKNNKNIFHNNALTTNEDIIETKQITESKDEIQNLKEEEKTQFLEALGEEANRDTFNNILSNEISRLKNINEKKSKLKDINLIEQNYEELYEWTNLFNNSRPISSYTTLKKPKLNIKEDNKIEEFKSPVVLVDLYEDQMNLYFGKNNFLKNESDSKAKIKNKLLIKKNIKKNARTQKKKNLSINTNATNTLSNQKSKKNITSNINITSKTGTHHHIRPMSVYSPRGNSCSFYFSSTFSDYYKEDLKSFSEKMKILKAKIKSNPNKLNHEIKTQRKISSSKETKLNNILNLQKYNFVKENLIIAAERRNPIPLLKSIFKDKYPNREIMKEHIKIYNNTMKPLGDSNGIVDYTKNDRWRLSEQIAQMRERAKNLKLDKIGVEYDNENDTSRMGDYFINKRNSNRSSNLILSYYNKNDPYIKMFEKMAKKESNIFQEKEKSENNKNNFNPILQAFNNFNSNISIPYNKQIIIEQKEIMPPIDEKIEMRKNVEEDKAKKKEIIDNNDIINNNERPKTTKRSVGSYTTNPIFTRPLTSIFKQYNIFYTNINQDNKINDNNINTPDSNLEYTSSNRFPLKTISNVGNASYDKINQMLQERQFGYYKVKYDYFITSTGQIKNISHTPKTTKTQKYKEEKIILPKSCSNNKENNNKWNENMNKNKSKKNKLNFYNFDNIKSDFSKKNKKSDNFYTLKYFKNFGGKFYSSSNNVNVKNKRNNKNKLLTNFYTDSRYSKDEHEDDIDFVDEAISSQSNSSFRKIIT